MGKIAAKIEKRTGRLVAAGVLLLAGWALAGANSALAGNPIQVDSQGRPVRWNQQTYPIRVQIEIGPENPGGDPPLIGGLGGDDPNEPAIMPYDVVAQLTVNSLNAWEVSPFSNIDFEIGSTIDRDITGDEFILYFNTPPAGQNPIIFDQDGTAFEELGLGPEVLGVAGPTALQGGFIIQGRAAVQGRMVSANDDRTRIRVQSVTTHELGHMLGFGHAEVNGSLFFLSEFGGGDLGGIGAPAASQIELMYPIISPQPRVAPHFDDFHIAANLYPLRASQIDPETGPFFGSFSGEVFDALGAGLAGVTVVARRPEDPFEMAAGVIAGSTADPSAPDLEVQQRRYLLKQLPVGQYYLNTAEPTQGSYSSPVASSSFGVESPLISFYPGPHDFYGGDEPTPFDDPTVPAAQLLEAGDALENLDIQLNRYAGSVVGPRVAEVEPNNSRFGNAPQDVEYGSRIFGSITVGDASSAVGLEFDLFEDFYRFEVPPNEELCVLFDLDTFECLEMVEGDFSGATVIQTSQTDANLELALFSADGELLDGTGVNSQSKAAHTKSVFLEAGSYVVGVSVDDTDAETGRVNYMLDIGTRVLLPAPRSTDGLVAR